MSDVMVMILCKYDIKHGKIYPVSIGKCGSSVSA